MANRLTQRPAFTLLELMIAVGILGVGLTMVAAVFPVALSQHRDASDISLSQRVATKSQAVLQARLQSELLYVPPPNVITALGSAPAAPPTSFTQPPVWPLPVKWFAIPAEIL